MASLENCLICDSSLRDGQTCVVKTKDLKILISFSIKRRDGKYTIFKRLSSVTVHDN